jgi:SH3-like domain-containing protein
VQVEREDTDFPGWFWCRNIRGREGWVHRSVLASTEERTTSVRSYNALELTVTEGESGVLLERLDGWLRLRLDDGREGWMPESHATFSGLRP